MSYIANYHKWYRIEVTPATKKPVGDLVLAVKYDTSLPYKIWTPVQGPNNIHYSKHRFTFIVPELISDTQLTFTERTKNINQDRKHFTWPELLKDSLHDISKDGASNQSKYLLITEPFLTWNFCYRVTTHVLPYNPLSATSFYTIGLSASLTHSTRFFNLEESTIMSVYAYSEYYDDLMNQYHKGHPINLHGHGNNIILSTNKTQLNRGSCTERGVLLYRSYDLGTKTKTPNYYTFTFDARHLLPVINPKKYRSIGASLLSTVPDASSEASAPDAGAITTTGREANTLLSSPSDGGLDTLDNLDMIGYMPLSDSTLAQISLRFEITNIKGKIVGVNESSLYQVISPFITHMKRVQQKRLANRLQPLSEPKPNDPSVDLKAVPPHSTGPHPTSAGLPPTSSSSSAAAAATMDSVSPLILSTTSHVGCSRFLTPQDSFKVDLPLHKDYSSLQKSARGQVTVHEALHHHLPSTEHTFTQIQDGVVLRPMLILDAKQLQPISINATPLDRVMAERNSLVNHVEMFTSYIHPALHNWFSYRTKEHTMDDIHRYFYQYYETCFQEDLVTDPVLQFDDEMLHMHRSLLDSGEPSLLSTLTPAGIPMFVLDCTPPPEHCGIRNISRTSSGISKEMLQSYNGRYPHAAHDYNLTHLETTSSTTEGTSSSMSIPPQSSIYGCPGINRTGIITNDAKYAFQLKNMAIGGDMDSYNYQVYDTRQLFPNRYDYPLDTNEILAWTREICGKLKPRIVAAKSPQLDLSIPTRPKFYPVNPPQSPYTAGECIDRIMKYGARGGVTSHDHIVSGQYAMVDFIAEYIINRTKNELMHRSFHHRIQSTSNPQQSDNNNNNNNNNIPIPPSPMEYHVVFFMGIPFNTSDDASRLFKTLYTALSHLPVSLVFIGSAHDEGFSRSLTSGITVPPSALPLGDIAYPHKYAMDTNISRFNRPDGFGDDTVFTLFDGMSIPNPHRTQSIHSTLDELHLQRSSSLDSLPPGTPQKSPPYKGKPPMSPEVLAATSFQRDMFIHYPVGYFVPHLDPENTPPGTPQIPPIKHRLLIQVQQYLQCVFKARMAYDVRTHVYQPQMPPLPSSPALKSLFQDVYPFPPPFPSWIPTIRPPHVSSCALLQSPEELVSSSSSLSTATPPGGGVSGGTLLSSSLSSFASGLSRPNLIQHVSSAGSIDDDGKLCVIEDMYLSSPLVEVIDNRMKHAAATYTQYLNTSILDHLKTQGNDGGGGGDRHQEPDYCQPPPLEDKPLEKSISGDVPLQTEHTTIAEAQHPSAPQI